MPARCASPRCRISSSVRPASSGCSWVCTNQPGRTRAPSLAEPRCGTGSIGVSPTGRCSTSGSLPPAASSRRKWDLPDPLEPSTATRSPYQTSRSKAPHQPGELEALADHGALARAAALEPHRDLLLARLVGRRPGLLELAQPGLRGLVLRGQPVVVLRLDSVAQHQRLELGVLLVPAPAQLLEAREAVGARLVVRREATRVGPHGVAGGAELDRDHAGRGVGEQLAVVADEQDRLVRLAHAAARARSCRARRGSCRARRAAAPRRGRRGGTPAPAASARRRRGSTGRGTSRGRRAGPSASTVHTSQVTSTS